MQAVAPHPTQGDCLRCDFQCVSDRIDSLVLVQVTKRKDFPLSTRVFIGNIPYLITEEELDTELTNLGHPPAEVRVIKDRETGQGRGFAFIEYGSSAAAEAAVRELNGISIQGRSIRGDTASERQGGGRQGGGGPSQGRPPAKTGRHEHGGRGNQHEDVWREDRRRGKRERW